MAKKISVFEDERGGVHKNEKDADMVNLKKGIIDALQEALPHNTELIDDGDLDEDALNKLEKVGKKAAELRKLQYGK